MKLGRLALYGGGKMGMAMLGGWLQAGVDPNRVAVYDPMPSGSLKESKTQINPVDFEADIVVLAVKPQIMAELLAEVKLPNHALVISVAAGVNLGSMEEALGAKTRIIRAMPNTPAAIGKGITAIVGNDAAGKGDLQTASQLLQSIGQVVELEKESDMDAVTGLSGSGPAYVFYMIEAMREAGMAQGLSEHLAHQLALATVAGAGELAGTSEDDPSVLRQNVTSPGGTTQAGLGVLMNEESGLAPLMAQTVAAAAERSRELGKT